MKMKIVLSAAALLLGLIAVTMLWTPSSQAHMTDQCLGKMQSMNTWIEPKKADAIRLGATGEQLTALVPVNVRMALAKGEAVPHEWAPDLNQVAVILDTFGSAASNFLLADEMFTEKLGELLLCIAEAR